MHRDADRPRLVRNGARNRLANPPRRVCREFVTAAVLKFVHRLHQADVSFLNQVEELQSAIRVLLRDRDHQAQVRFNQLPLRLLRVHIALDHLALRALELGDDDARLFLQLFEVDLAVLLLPAVFLPQLFAA